MGWILVTGATGFIGSNLVRMLIEEDGVEPACIRVLVRAGSPRAWVLDGLPVERITGGLDDRVTLARGLEDCERVYHCAAYVHVGTAHRARYLRTNVEGTRGLLRLARERGVPRAVVMSSIAATALGAPDQPATEDTPFDLDRFRLPYVETKRAQEQLALAESRDGLDVVVVNPGFVFGPGDVKPVTGMLLLAMARGLYPFVPGGSMSTVDVRDVCRGTILAGDRGRPGHRYILTHHYLSYLELGQLVAEIHSSRPPRGTLPRSLLVLAGLLADLPTQLGFDPPFNSRVALYAASHHHTSGERATRELGLEYRPLECTIRDALEWFGDLGYLSWTRRKLWRAAAQRTV